MKSAANNDAAPVSAGELVWVRTGLGSHEEPAVVLKVDCEWEDSDESKNKTTIKDDGVLVKINVSAYEGIYAPSRIRRMGSAPSASRRRRCSPRTVSPVPPKDDASSSRSRTIRANKTGKTVRVMVQPSATISASSTAPKNKKKDKTTSRIVTPSPSESFAAESEEDGKRRSKRKTGSTTTTPASSKPKKTRKDEPSLSSIKDNDEEDSKMSPYFERSKQANADIESESDIRLCVQIPPVASAAAGKRESSDSEEEEEDCKPSASARMNNNNNDPAPGEPDGNGGLNQPSTFHIEYSTTSRATCRRCDKLIRKDEIRVSHKPHFRGKPGFRVYRHLHCAIFSEEIMCAEDVPGFSDLEPEDYEKLALRVEESRLEVQRENEELEPDELVPVAFQGEIRAPPPKLTANLLPFQVEGASWMYHQEVHEDMRGGILADEMGMGKTLQTIVTILDNRPKLQHSKPGAKHPPSADVKALSAEEKLWNSSVAEWKHEMDMSNVPKSVLPKGSSKKSPGGARAGTLVVCPVVALSQWKAEIEKFCEEGALSICVYHGPNRAAETPREMLRKYDIILTTYQVIECEYRKMASPNKVKCPNCGGKFKIDKLRVHLKYFCGEGAQRTEAQARQRRNSDRGGRPNGNGQGGNPRSGGRRGKKKFAKTPSQSSTASATKKEQKKTALSKSVRVGGSADFESESELSAAEDDEAVPSSGPASRRPARSAGVKARKLVSASAKSWMSAKADNSSGSDAYSADTSSEDENSSDDEPQKPTQSKKKGKARAPVDSSSSSEEDVVLARAREKQKEAMRLARKRKDSPKTKKTASKAKNNSRTKKRKSGGATKKPAAKGKHFDSSDDSDTSSESDDDDDNNNGISEEEMKRLIEEAMAGSQMSVLHSFSFWRVVLDEAHMIKTRSSQTAAAAFALVGVHRWCLSGTPLQNRVGEFYSLIRFLRIDPMAHYFCRAKDCDCKSLHYRMMNGKCQGCGHSSVQHYSQFNKYVLNPIQRDGYSGDGRRAMFILKNEVLDKCLLRRTKETRAEEIHLPPRLVSIRSVRLHPVEEDFYDALYTQTRSSFNDYVADGTLLNNYAHIFDLLMRMRQAVDHPYLVVYSKKGGQGQVAGPAVANGSIDCDICNEPPTDRIVSSCCNAAFCRSCVIDFLSAAPSNTPCPSCQAPLSIDLNQAQANVVDDSTLSVGSRGSSSSTPMPSLKELPHVATGSVLRRLNLAEFATSTKIEALTEELIKMRQTSPGSKAIVFSQFVNMLDLIRWRLHSDPCLADMGLGARALHGGMDVKARDESLKDFREDPSVRVLLVSLKAGGVALNLTVANYIFLMDPWWNPAAEMQAIDRTHRLGQYRPIRAIRFIAEDTVEERILQLQEKKRLVFDGTVGRDAGSLKMLTVDDMKSLFA